MKIRHRAIGLAAVLLLTGTSTAAMATPASATAWAHISNLAYRQCIEVPGSQVNVVLRIAPCRASDAQLWTGVPTPDGRIFLVNKLTGYCAEVNQGTSVPGERVDAWYCNGTLAEQWIRAFRIGGLSFINAGSRLCLDTVAGGGSDLMQWYCDPNNRAQIWAAA